MVVTNELWGSNFFDFVYVVETFLGKVIWRDPNELLIDVVHRDALQKVFLEREVFFLNNKDSLFWAAEKYGGYIIKDG